MIHQHMTVPGVGARLAALGIAIALAGVTRGGEEQRHLTVPEFTASERNQFAKLARGGNLPDDAGELLAKAAKYYINRLTLTEYQQPRTEGSARPTMDALVHEACQVIQVPSSDHPLTDAQQNFLEEYGRHLLADIRAVLRNPEPIARVNAARILAYLGRAGLTKSADEMLEALDSKEKQLEAVKLYCFRGLKDLLVFGTPKPELKARIIQALIEYITRPQDPGQHVLPGQIEGIQYVRREAIRALAEARIPLGENGKNPAALVLMRTMRGDGFVPPPSSTERVAAAIGLCHMQARLADGYEPEYAASQLGWFVTELIVEYDSDLGQRAGKEGKSQAWRMLAAKLILALDEFNNDTKKKNAYVNKVVDRATTLLREADGERTLDPAVFQDWLQKNPPEPKSLYKDDPTAVIHGKTAG